MCGLSGMTVPGKTLCLAKRRSGAQIVVHLALKLAE